MKRPRLPVQASTVLFDLDGTLLDTAPDLVAALHAVCAEEKQPAPPASTAACYVSQGAIGLVRLAFPDYPPAELERLRARLVALYQQTICANTQPYPGIREMLDALTERDIRWGIVTNKLRFLAEPIIAATGLQARCAVLVGGDCAGRSKPHPDPLNLALERIGEDPAATVYVGDAEKDMAAGRAAGVTTVAVTWGYIIPGEKPENWGADYLISAPQELLEL